jgi:putative aldouronate transport system substrate-binding protein
MKPLFVLLGCLTLTPVFADETVLEGYLIGTPPAGLEPVAEALNVKLRPLGTKLELNYIGWNELNSRYALVLASGDGIDWIFTASWAQFTTQAVRGAFRELTPDDLRTYMPRHWKNTPPEAWEQAKVNGKIFMVPTATPDRKVPVALIRGDLRQKYGLAPIKNLRELEPYLAAVKAHEPRLVPINLGNGYDIGQPFFALLNNEVPPIFNAFAGTLYGNYEDPRRSIINLLDPPYSDAYRRTAIIMKRWYDRGYINRAPFANTVLSKESFAQGRSAVGFGNSLDVQDVLARAVAAGYSPEIIPILSSTGHSKASSYIDNGFAIAASSRNWQKTLQALDLIMEDPDTVRLVYYGIENTDYTLRADGSLTPISGEYPVDASGFWFVNRNLLPPLSTWTADYTDHRVRLKNYLVPDSFQGYIFDPSRVRAPIAAITTVMAQYADVLTIGAVADVDKAIAQLDRKLAEARQDLVLDELQRQLQR